MNIYFLHDDPHVAATLHVDDHLRPMYVEAVAMMTAATQDGEDNLHVRSHPMTQWVGSNRKHYVWTWRLAEALNREHEHRFGETLPYAAELERLRWLADEIEDRPWRNPPRCIHDWCKVDHDRHVLTGANHSAHVASYRLFYAHRVESRDIPAWTKREVPSWYAEQLGA